MVCQCTVCAADGKKRCTCFVGKRTQEAEEGGGAAKKAKVELTEEVPQDAPDNSTYKEAADGWQAQFVALSAHYQYKKSEWAAADAKYKAELEAVKQQLQQSKQKHDEDRVQWARAIGCQEGEAKALKETIERMLAHGYKGKGGK